MQQTIDVPRGYQRTAEHIEQIPVDAYKMLVTYLRVRLCQPGVGILQMTRNGGVVRWRALRSAWYWESVNDCYISEVHHVLYGVRLEMSDRALT